MIRAKNIASIIPPSPNELAIKSDTGDSVKYSNIVKKILSSGALTNIRVSQANKPKITPCGKHPFIVHFIVIVNSLYYYPLLHPSNYVVGVLDYIEYGIRI